MVETTALDIDRGEPARTHVRAALEGLAHVVTANKGPAAFAYAELDALAESVDRVFFFEGAVMDGVPVFNLVRETMPGVVVNGFRGVINTTCHYMLSSMEHGTSPDDAVLDMQARGIAEADPVARHRRVGRGGEDRGARQRPDGRADHAARRRAHRHPQHLGARGRRGARSAAGGSGWWPRRHGAAAGSTSASSPSCSMPATRWPSLGALENALYLHTDLLGDVGIVQRTSSLTQTAYALVSDLSHISQRLQEL